MMSRRGKLPVQSIIVCAFFHDLGKAESVACTSEALMSRSPSPNENVSKRMTNSLLYLLSKL